MIAELLSMEFSGVALDEALSGIPVSLETDIIRYLATENKHIIYISHRENPSIDSMADIALSFDIEIKRFVMRLIDTEADKLEMMVSQKMMTLHNHSSQTRFTSLQLV